MVAALCYTSGCLVEAQVWRCTSMPLRRSGIALICAISCFAGAARAELVREVWRSPYGYPRSISVNATDGTAWAAIGANIVRLDIDGNILASAGGFWVPESVSVSPSDGSCWVADTLHNQIVHLDANGAETWRGGNLEYPLSVSTDPNDGSCWVASTNQDQVVHFAADGTELGRVSGFYFPGVVAVSPMDSSCWVADTWNDQLVHLSPTGEELRRDGEFRGVSSLAVDPSDGSVWVCPGRSPDQGLVHLAADGTELARMGFLFFDGIGRLSVDPTDGSCWVIASDGGEVSHVASDGTYLWQGGDYGGDYGEVPTLCLSPYDGSVWLGDGSTGQIIRLDSGGSELWRRGAHDRPGRVVVDPADGSTWVVEDEPGQLVHAAKDGTELWRGYCTPVSEIAVDPNNGSVWLTDPYPWGSNELVHLSRSGGELVRVGGFSGVGEMVVVPNDSSVWASVSVGGDWQLVHLSASGDELWRGGNFAGAVALNPADGSVWVADYGWVAHIAGDGAELTRLELDYASEIAVNTRDGSVWVSAAVPGPVGLVYHLGASGTQLSVTSGLLSPCAVAVNSVDGSCWVLDGVGNQAICLDENGAEVWRGTDLSIPYGLAVNEKDGSVWIADTGDSQIVRLHGPLFRDVPADQWAYDAIASCVQASLAAGYEDGSYHPGEPVTRAQMAVYIARGLAGGDADVHVPTGLAEPSFTDVGTDHWAYRCIEYAAAANVVQGYGDGRYQPDATVDRGQMAVYIARALVSPTGDAALPDPPAEPTFSDVSAENDWAWCYPHVEYLAAEMIVQGYSDGTYHPEQAVTRDQMAVYVARAFELPM
jgi:DNA-binding beta-propeller fold protein YncE